MFGDVIVFFSGLEYRWILCIGVVVLDYACSVSGFFRGCDASYLVDRASFGDGMRCKFDKPDLFMPCAI